MSTDFHSIIRNHLEGHIVILLSLLTHIRQIVIELNATHNKATFFYELQEIIDLINDEIKRTPFQYTDRI